MDNNGDLRRYTLPIQMQTAKGNGWVKRPFSSNTNNNNQVLFLSSVFSPSAFGSLVRPVSTGHGLCIAFNANSVGETFEDNNFVKAFKKVKANLKIPHRRAY